LPLHQSIAHNVSGLVLLSVLGAIALVVTCVLAYRMRARGPLMSFGVAWFLLLLLPTSSIFPLEHVVAEHRVYLASMGFFLIVATLLAWLDQRLRRRSVGLLVGLAAAGMLALMGLASLTMSRIVVWSHPVTLWREAAITAPRWDTFTALGNALRDANDCERAVVAYRIASQLAPESLIPLGASVICLTVLGRTVEAREVVQRIRQADPTLQRLCTEAHGAAARTLSVESCIEQLRPYFGANSGR